MTRNSKTMVCIVGSTVRNVIEQANQLEIQREDVVNIFALGGQIYLIYYK